MADILIAAGADPNAKSSVTAPRVPLAGADSVLTDGQGGMDRGYTPLDLAKSNKSQEMIKLLEAASAR